ncbi:MAG TPA: diacylglycerol kinase family protein [Kofleriaceae bacterium]|nr:diacylglycerol kinase family protein [Kofleriaceae bacterium]
MSSRAVLVANPTAQSGRAAVAIEQARRLLDAAGLAHGFLPTEPEGGTVAVVRRAVDEGGARLVIAMGGDGTFAEAAKGVLASGHAAEVSLGLLPTGTANDQAKSFGLATGEAGLERNVEIIRAGVTRAMDAGRVERLDEADRVTHQDLFFDSFSLGLGAAVLAERNRDRRRVADVPFIRALYRDNLVYAGALVKKLARSPSFHLEAVVDGQVLTYQDVLDVIVKNTPVYGGKWVLANAATSDDGLLEMVPIVGLGDFTSKAVSALRGSPIGEYELAQLGIKPTRPVPGREFTLTAFQPGVLEPLAAQVDGEELPAGERFRIVTLPRLLRMIVPAPAEV